MSAPRTFFATDRTVAPLLLRVTLAVVILPHGLQKLLGWFGGYGFSGTMEYFTETLGIPWTLGLAAIAAECLGAVLLTLGLATRLAAAGVAAVLATAMLMVHSSNGFFMNWFGNQPGEGIEYFLLGLSIAGALVVAGGGAFSLDRIAMRRLGSTHGAD